VNQTKYLVQRVTTLHYSESDDDTLRYHQGSLYCVHLKYFYLHSLAETIGADVVLIIRVDYKSSTETFLQEYSTLSVVDRPWLKSGVSKVR